MLTRLSKKPLLLGLGSAILIAVTCMIVGISFAEEKPDKLAEGDKQFEEKSYRKAYEAYVDYLKDHPDSADWFRIKLRMGHCQAQLGNHDKAEKELTELADKDGLSDLERGRADYRLGHYFMERPHYYYENSKGVKSWGNWIADSSYHNTQKEDTERAKDRLAASFKLLEPEGRKALKTLGENPDSVSMVEEAYNTGSAPPRRRSSTPRRPCTPGSTRRSRNASRSTTSTPTARDRPTTITCTSLRTVTRSSRTSTRWSSSRRT